MRDYRIYPLSPTGQTDLPVHAECADDAAALLAARALADQVRNGCEVWELTRFHFPSPPVG